MNTELAALVWAISSRLGGVADFADVPSPPVDSPASVDLGPPPEFGLDGSPPPALSPPIDLSVEEAVIWVDPMFELSASGPKLPLAIAKTFRAVSFTGEIKWMRSRRRITHRMQWQRSGAPIWVAPGAEANPSLKVKVGVSTTTTKELSATLGLKPA